MTGQAEPPTISVDGTDQTSDASVDVGRWCHVAAETLRREGVIYGQLDLLFVDQAEMTDLNRTHMGADGPTDVLAFPLDGPEAVEDGGHTADADGPPRHLGDVVICPDVARRQAPEHSGDVDSEFTLLVVHGVLHVLGHDHAEPAETLEMQARERSHLAHFGFTHPVVSA